MMFPVFCILLGTVKVRCVHCCGAGSIAVPASLFHLVERKIGPGKNVEVTRFIIALLAGDTYAHRHDEFLPIEQMMQTVSEFKRITM